MYTICAQVRHVSFPKVRGIFSMTRSSIFCWLFIGLSIWNMYVYYICHCNTFRNTLCINMIIIIIDIVIKHRDRVSLPNSPEAHDTRVWQP
jgi:hypothetical protein